MRGWRLLRREVELPPGAGGALPIRLPAHTLTLGHLGVPLMLGLSLLFQPLLCRS